MWWSLSNKLWIATVKGGMQKLDLNILGLSLKSGLVKSRIGCRFKPVAETRLKLDFTKSGSSLTNLSFYEIVMVAFVPMTTEWTVMVNIADKRLFLKIAYNIYRKNI